MHTDLMSAGLLLDSPVGVPGPHLALAVVWWVPRSMLSYVRIHIMPYQQLSLHAMIRQRQAASAIVQSKDRGLAQPVCWVGGCLIALG